MFKTTVTNFLTPLSIKLKKKNLKKIVPPIFSNFQLNVVTIRFSSLFMKPMQLDYMAASIFSFTIFTRILKMLVIAFDVYLRFYVETMLKQLNDQPTDHKRFHNQSSLMLSIVTDDVAGTLCRHFFLF